MLTKEIQYRYDEWIKNVSGDLLHELEKMDEKAIEDAFYKDLGFGTGGLRGRYGCGNELHEYMRCCEGKPRTGQLFGYRRQCRHRV